MRQTLLRTSMLIGVGSLMGTLAGAGSSPASASDGIKLSVGGYFSSAYVGLYDGKYHHDGRIGNERNFDALKHDAEVHFDGETTLDNGLTIAARIELEGENDADQIDKTWVSWSGGFGLVRIGDQDDALETQCPYVPGGTANFSAFSPTGWASNDPIGSNSYCFSADSDAQKITYLSPVFTGFQLAVSYTPSSNASDYTQVGVNGSGTPTHPEGSAHHIVSAYVTYGYEGEDWSMTWGGGGSWQLTFNDAFGANDGKTSAYQTSGSVTFGAFSVGGSFNYFDQGGSDNDLWTAGAGASYAATDQITLGLQYSHGRYEGDFLGDGFGTDSGLNLNRVVTTVSYALAPGVDLDADLGYTWYHDGRDGTPGEVDSYKAFEVGIGSSLTF